MDNNFALSSKCLSEMRILLDTRKKLEDRSEIDDLIADAAEKFVDSFLKEGEEEIKEISSETKSEMPCNCHEKKVAKVANNLQEIVQEIIEDATSKLTDNNTFAAIVFRVN